MRGGCAVGNKVEEQKPEEATEEEQHTDPEPEAAVDEEQQTYPAKIVKDLRKENANFRERLQQLSRALFAERVKATGKVENPGEIPYNADILDDADAINQAVDAAIAERPYIKARKVTGDVGQGQRSKTAAPQDFSMLLRG
jgi:hypothetical protein